MLKSHAIAFLFTAAIPVCLAGSNIATAASHTDHVHEQEHADHEAHVSELNGLRSIHAWSREAHKGEDALVFVELQNHSDAEVSFEGAEFDHADAVELVGFTLQDGKDVYVPIAKMPLKAGQKMLLAPKALAIRLSNIEMDLHKGETFDMHFLFDIGEMHVNVAVESASASHHSHVGHIHETKP